MTLDHYLHSSFQPDKEFIEGELVDRNIGSILHVRAVVRLLTQFVCRDEGLHLLAIPSCRLMVSPTRCRVPDVMVVRTPTDMHAPAYQGVPLAVVEVLEPEDRLTDVAAKCRDYAALGIEHIALLDPWQPVACRFTDGRLIEAHFERLAPFEFPTAQVSDAEDDD